MKFLSRLKPSCSGSRNIGRLAIAQQFRGSYHSGESGPNFLKMLRERFPRAHVVKADAARLAGLELHAPGTVGAVVSGLPLLSMSPRKIMGVLTGAFHYLRADGAFYQFTYGPRCPVPKAIRERLGLESKRVGRTLRNLPPATVYRITRKKTPTAS